MAEAAAGDPAATSQPEVSFDEISVRFSGRTAVERVTFDVPRGQFVSVIGPSGCGKSTILNLCAGLLKPSTGTVSCYGSVVADVNTDVGYVTQDANLLPWLSVAANIAMPLKFRGYGKSEQQQQVARWIDMMGLTGFEENFPRELSGGMRRRASLARAMIYDPSVVLMDEPFGALDAITRTKLQQELLNLCQSEVRTVIFVTHDLTEAIALSDRVVVMSGRPGTVKGIVDVPIERPREIIGMYDDPTFSKLSKDVWGLFQADDERAHGRRS